ncbi:hypothetical protein AJ79_02214 [Helicocarpus griseus UAMH5409]|uniref:Calcineurin-like phosphoesterase domain-containing protein n=1 Tax=Helicocarpus griseus UAMH5409 TaxID=1447875 RepID=A0A2B7Y474_9EURO|nr:hypothetical protein AJ79_02214 [Helicocarpus griseus UAMH5409]
MAGKSISPPSIGQPKPRPNFLVSAATNLHSWYGKKSYRSSSSKNLSTNSNNIKVVCVADTHNTQQDLPPGDLLVHAGDLSQYGTFDEIQKQLNWLSAQPHKFKVAIAGNHDLLLDADFCNTHPDRELEDGRETAYKFTNNSVELEFDDTGRKVKIFGSPLTPRFGNFAFQYDRAEAEAGVWERLGIPRDTDILLMHGPPAGLLDDDGKGCEHLLKELWRIQPRLMVFGHIHPGRGQRRIRFDEIEACYEDIILKRPRQLLNFLVLTWKIAWVVFVGVILRQRGDNRAAGCSESQLVNAVVVGGKNGSERREAICVVI